MLDEKIIDRLKELGFNIEDSEVTYVNILKWLATEKGVLIRVHGHWDFERELPIYKAWLYTVIDGRKVEDEIMFSGEGEDYEAVRLECLTKCLDVL